MADQFAFKTGNPNDWGKGISGVQGLKTPQIDGGGTVGMQDFYSAQQSQGIDPMNSADLWGQDSAASDYTGKVPDAKGGWMEKGQLALGVAKVGLGVYNALEQSKMNKFMKGYYGDQMDLQTADFENNARSANENLASKRERVLSAQGTTTGTDANRQGVSSYMDKWGAQETV